MENASTTMLPGQNFDPLQGFNFTGKEDDPDYEEYIPPIEKPDDYDEPAPVTEEVPAEERIAALFRGMPGHEKLLAHVIEFCEEQQDSEDVYADLEAFRGSAVALYSADTICANLLRAGALDMIVLEDEASETEENEGVVEEAIAGSDIPEGNAENAIDKADSASTPDTQRVELARFAYVATPEGLAAAAEVRAEVPVAQEKLFESDGMYLPIYLRILEAAANGEGLSKKEIDAMVDKDPICANPRRYSGYFVKALEAAEAMRFDSLWYITNYGQQFLEEHTADIAE